MTEKNNIGIMKKYFESLASGNFEGLKEIFDENIVWHQPGTGSLSGTYRGIESLFGLFGKFMEISKGSFKIDEVKAIMGNGDLVSAILHFQAEKDGQQISMDGIDLMKIEKGKIKEVWLFSGDQEAEDAFWN